MWFCREGLTRACLSGPCWSSLLFLVVSLIPHKSPPSSSLQSRAILLALFKCGLLIAMAFPTVAQALSSQKEHGGWRQEHRGLQRVWRGGEKAGSGCWLGGGVGGTGKEFENGLGPRKCPYLTLRVAWRLCLEIDVRPGHGWRSAGRESWSFILGSFYTWCSVQLFIDKPDGVCGSRDDWGWPVSVTCTYTRIYVGTHGHLRNSPHHEQLPPTTAPAHQLSSPPTAPPPPAHL